MAAGKSHIAKALAKCTKSRFYDTDELICQHTGMDIPTIFKNEGEVGFRKHEAEVVQKLIGNRNMVVATGGGVVLDKQNCKNMKDNGRVIYLCTSLDTRYERVRNSTGRPLLMVGDIYETMQNLDRVRIPLYETLADFIVDNNGTTEAAVTKIVEYIHNTNQT